MGALCSKSSNKTDPFDQPGRTLGSAPPPRPDKPRATVPKVTGPGRTLGTTAGAESGDDPRAAAARAAEERAKQTQPKGKLAEQLAAQKKQTRTSTLEQASREERGFRDADSNANARAWQ